MIKSASVRLAAGLPAATTVVETMRWEPTVKTSSWHYVPQSVQLKLMAMAARDPASFELAAILEGATSDTLINVAWAEVDSAPNPDLAGWAIANFWPTAQGSDGVLLLFLQPGYNNNEKVHSGLVTRLLASLFSEDRPDAVNLNASLNISRRDKLLFSQLDEYGFGTINTILP